VNRHMLTTGQQEPATQNGSIKAGSWLNRTTLGIGLTSLFSDWSHEIATSILPAFLVSLGAGPSWLGAIEGTADGLSSFSKLAAGHYTDRLKNRKPLVQSGYVVTTLATGALALATSAWHVLVARTTAWLGRGGVHRDERPYSQPELRQTHTAERLALSE
jgi:MFS family permease